MVIQNNVKPIVSQELGHPEKPASRRLRRDILVTDTGGPRDVARSGQRRGHPCTRRHGLPRGDDVGSDPAGVDGAAGGPHDVLRGLGELEEGEGEAHGVDLVGWLVVGGWGRGDGKKRERKVSLRSRPRSRSRETTTTTTSLSLSSSFPLFFFPFPFLHKGLMGFFS